ncbi:SDR family oxidoreductase [Wenjunlia tyrosinilytica]|uniref:Short chain dehydrogenase n=1 Tax=Wenjunlia tyrosinilytica TaxID=1544741 RepID=A0A918DWA3_9ACTN|nr:SDR family oxidoreductase [Wenjunlia tyrosinilytica]GGO86403.1 short chain dehydrogenase [Wenjunlia tyrosinilytica]
MTRFVESAGVRLAVAEWGADAAGERPTVLLLHGYPDCKEVWREVAGELAERFHVVAYDVRGHGASTAPRPQRGGYRLEKLADDFEAVLDAIGADRPVHLVGHDWGSVQGWEFATRPRFEGRLASFTSMSGPSLDHFGLWIKERMGHPTPRRLAQLLGQGVRSWYVYALHTPVLPELAWRGPLGRLWPKLLARAERLPAGSCPTTSLPEDAAHGAWLYRDNVRERLLRPREDAYARIPVQLITPTGDPFLSEHLYDGLDRWAPRLRRRTVAAKHWLPRTRPQLLARWITDFVDDVERGRSSGESAVEAPRSHAPLKRGALGAAAERFAGRLVLVTGAGSGIGRATAFAFAEAGARVVAVDRDGDSAARTAELALLSGAREAWAQTVDVAEEQAMDKLADRVHTEYGVVDVLVNNAGIGISGRFLDTSVEDWRRTLDVNLWGVIHGCRLFGRRMAERGEGGHIVNIASAAAYQPTKTLPAYSTSKAAVLMLSECLRAEFAAAGIGVSAICPGFVNTSITATARFVGATNDEQERLRRKASRMYRRRNYPPEKVADAIVRAVIKDIPVLPVTPEARTARMLGRVSPGALRALGRIDSPL